MGESTSPNSPPKGVRSLPSPDRKEGGLYVVSKAPVFTPTSAQLFTVWPWKLGKGRMNSVQGLCCIPKTSSGMCTAALGLQNQSSFVVGLWIPQWQSPYQTCIQTTRQGFFSRTQPHARTPNNAHSKPHRLPCLLGSHQ